MTLKRHDVISQVEEVEDFIQYVSLTLALSENRETKVVKEKRIGYYEWSIYSGLTESVPFMIVETNGFGKRYDIRFYGYYVSDKIYRRNTEIYNDEILCKYELKNEYPYLDFWSDNIDDLRTVFHKVLPYLVYL